MTLHITQGAALPLALLVAINGLEVAASLPHDLHEQPVDAGGSHGVDEAADVELARVEHAVGAGLGQDGDAAGVKLLATFGEPGVGILTQHMDGEGTLDEGE